MNGGETDTLPAERQGQQKYPRNDTGPKHDGHVPVRVLSRHYGRRNECAITGSGRRPERRGRKNSPARVTTKPAVPLSSGGVKRGQSSVISPDHAVFNSGPVSDSKKSCRPLLSFLIHLPTVDNDATRITCVSSPACANRQGPSRGCFQPKLDRPYVLEMTNGSACRPRQRRVLLGTRGEETLGSLPSLPRCVSTQWLRPRGFPMDSPSAAKARSTMKKFFSANEQVLPRPPEAPQAMHTPGTAPGGELVSAFKLSEDRRRDLRQRGRRSLCDPQGDRRAEEGPQAERIAVPGGKVLGIRAEVWSRRIMPNPGNPRTLPIRRHPFAVDPGIAGEDSRFRPMPEPHSPTDQPDTSPNSWSRSTAGTT